MAGVRSTKEYNGNSSGAEEANPPIPRPQSPVPRHSLPRGITASVEPPRVSGYTFNKTPSPLSTIGLHVPRPRSTKIGSFPLAEIESRAEGSHRDAQIQNKSASAFLPQTGLGGKLKAKLMPGKTPEKAQNEIPSPTDIIQGNVPPWARIAPRVPVMNPESFHLKSRDGPKPPDEIVFHAELQRHGGTYNPNPGYTKQASPSGQQNNEDEASYQVDVTPPVIQQAPPRSIFMDPSLTLVGDEHAHATSAGHMANHADDSTWVLPSSSNTNALVPPVLNDPMRSPGTNLISLEGDAGLSAPGLSIPANSIAATHYDIDRPTCSLNLVCYRSGAKGCYLQQIQCVLRSRFAKEGDFRLVVLQNPHLVYDDAEFFKEMRRLFEIEMCGFLRRYFSLKSLKAFRVLAVKYTPTSRPNVVPFDDFVLQEMMHAYSNPGKLQDLDKDDWVRWVFRLRRKDRRHAVEFVEGWNTTRIAIAGSIPWLSSCIVGIAWASIGGDVQTAFTVAGFILTSSSIMFALLAIVSSLESSDRTIR